MRTSDLTRWALAVTLPKSPQIGADRVGRVLVALVQYADAERVAWPSADTLASDVSGVTRRDVRNALDVLVNAGLIEHTQAAKRGRTMRWLIAPNVAGMPANSQPVENVAGMPATASAELAGELAGNKAGMPAMKRTEQTTDKDSQSSVQLVSAGASSEVPPAARDALGSARLASLLGNDGWLSLRDEISGRSSRPVRDRDAYAVRALVADDRGDWVTRAWEIAGARRPAREHARAWAGDGTCYRPGTDDQPCLARREAVSA
jgi:hypothetical protein